MFKEKIKLKAVNHFLHSTVFNSDAVGDSQRIACLKYLRVFDYIDKKNLT